MRTIAHFELLDKLGAGGMGEVFKARDTRLNRFVAIKLLPEAAHSAARERFQREALAIAALNHPNICTLYDAGEQDGRPYLAMELLEGETLYARLARGSVSPAQLAQWGAEIADALQAAHAKGILHRDLKPGNIFITQRGSVKVLDFGLAQFAVASDSDSNAATVAGAAPALAQGAALPPLTTPGTALGTYAYMSPEQARGEPTDARSDIFSLGVVLYEMAGGRPPFRGRTSADVTAAILMLQPPPPSSLRPELPPKLDDIVAQCLEKEPEMRYQSAADLRVSLRRLQGASSASGPASTPSPGAVASGAPSSHPSAFASSASGAPPSTPAAVNARRPWLWPAAAAAVLIAAGLAWWGLKPRLAAHPPAASAAPQLQFRQLTFTGQILDAALSPHGKFLAHVDASPQGTSLHLMAVSNGSDTQIMPPSPECCQAPTFSPDGSSIYFTEYTKLLSLPVLGGEIRTIADDVCSSAGFSPDGKRIAYLATTNGGDKLMVAQADGSQPRVLNNPTPQGFNSRCWLGGPLEPDAPAWSPDGRWIAVDESGNVIGDHLALVDASNGQVHPLGPRMPQGTSDFAWLPDGSGLLLTNSIPGTAPSQLWELTYPAGKLLQLTRDLQGFERLSVASQSGATALEHIDPRYSVWAQAAPGGAFTELPGGGADQDGFDGLAWTNHGRLIATRTIAGNDQLWIEAGNQPAQPLPVDGLPTAATDIRVLPNGQLVFQGIRPGDTGWTIDRVNADGTGLINLAPGLQGIQPSPLQGGKALVVLAMYNSGGQAHQRLWSVPLNSGKPRELSPREFYTNFVLPMPDQQHVLALAVAHAAGASGVVEVSADGATIAPQNPRQYRGSFAAPYAITPDGRALTGVINSGNVGNIWAAPLNGAPLYEITHFTSQSIANYAFGPGGRLAVSRGSQNTDAVLATGLIPPTSK
jgi:serine/threonine protein kinase